MAPMYSEMVEGGALLVTLGGSGSGFGIWPVETATVHAASWFGSRGRLPLPMVIASPSCHTWDAKATPVEIETDPLPLDDPQGGGQSPGGRVLFWGLPFRLRFAQHFSGGGLCT